MSSIELTIPISYPNGSRYILSITKISNPPEGFDTPIFDVSLVKVMGVDCMQCIFNVSKRLMAYLNLYEDVILYFIYDDKEIKKGKRHQHLKPQQFRMLLFSTFFGRVESQIYYKNIEVEIDDNGHCLCWTLAGLKKKETEIEALGEIIEVEATK